jgi:hypothetical protein
MFPPHSAECQKSHNADVSLSSVNCDLRSDTLQNIYPTALIDDDHDLHYFITELSISPLMIDGMLDSTRLGGGTLSIDEAACAWVKGNVKHWKEWIPKPAAEEAVVAKKDNTVLVLAITIPLLLIAVAVAACGQLKAKTQTNKVAQLSTALTEAHLLHEQDLIMLSEFMPNLPKLLKKNNANNKKMADFVTKAQHTTRMRDNRNKTGSVANHAALLLIDHPLPLLLPLPPCTTRDYVSPKLNCTNTYTQHSVVSYASCRDTARLFAREPRCQAQERLDSI